MRLLLITEAYPPDASAPASRAYGFARAWTDAGHQVIVLTRAPTHLGFKNRVFQRHAHDGIEILQLGTWSKRDQLNHYPVSFLVAGLLQSVRLPKPDLVVSTAGSRSVAILARILSRGTPHILDLATANVGSQRDRVMSHLIRSAAGSLVPTSEHADHAREHGAHNLCLAQDGADLDLFHPPTNAVEFRRHHGLTGKFVVGAIAIKSDINSLAMLQRAAAMTSADSTLAWLFVGTTRERAILSVTPDAQPAANVVIITPLHRQHLPTFWSACDLALMPGSVSPDGHRLIPLAAFEAMAMRRPILNLQPGATQALIAQAKAGQTAATPKALVEAVRQFATNPDRAERHGAAGRHFVEQNHDQRITAQASLSLLALHAPKTP